MGRIKRELTGSEGDFWNAVEIYCRQPNSINKEIVYAEILCCGKLELQFSKSECQELYNKLHNYLFNEMRDIKDVIATLKNQEQVKLIDYSEVFNELSGTYVIMRKLLPKKTCYSNKDFYEVCFLDTEVKSVNMFSLFNKNQQNNCPFNIVNKEYDPFIVVKFNHINMHYDGNYLHIEYDDNLCEKGINWINSVFVHKMSKLISNGANKLTHGKLSFSSQINIIEYYKLYERLKQKYAKHLIENWSENTDPQKFVFEDIGIATYLLMLWNNGRLPKDSSEKQRFVDLGCGNGLLVYILNSEGHYGTGLDLRKRKIWDTYPSDVVLKEEAVVPGPSSTFPDADWLIGNHSDELTAWLPVMARRSGPNCQYFVLPCCPYQLNGKVYQRKNSGLSVYHDFIQYVRGISEICEFDTSIDRMRIPSTKRICIIGRKKELTVEEVEYIQKRIDDFIRKESGINSTNRINNLENGNSDKWIPEFRVRQAVETVRNCTKLPKGIVQEIILRIANCLLEKKNITKIIKENGENEWNQGGNVAISELANIMTQEQLKNLKNECKGLQTLIKNHHYVFHVSGGIVRFRTRDEMMIISQKVQKERGNFKWKEKNCWFHIYHPDGCPLEDSLCSYKHG